MVGGAVGVVNVDVAGEPVGPGHLPAGHDGDGHGGGRWGRGTLGDGERLWGDGGWGLHGGVVVRVSLAVGVGTGIGSGGGGRGYVGDDLRGEGVEFVHEAEVGLEGWGPGVRGRFRGLEDARRVGG